MESAISPRPVLAPQLEALEDKGIRHGFFTREGGVSQGIYRGLNIGVGSSDDASAVAENRRRIAQWMGVEPKAFLSLYQVHSPDVVIVDKPFEGERPKADGIVTKVPGLAIGATSADCGPILFAEPDAGVIGAAHAGWKGAFTGVLEATIDAMESIGAERAKIIAVLGPSISQKNYEVGPEFIERFCAEHPENQRYFMASDKPNHALFDLNLYTVDRLNGAGVQGSQLGRCTYAEEDLFFSYRRTTHRSEPDYGRQISVISLQA